MRALLLTSAAILTLAGSAHAAVTGHPEAEKQTLDLAEKAIALRSVEGPDNKTPQVAALFKSTLVDAGFSAEDITITPVDDTAYMIARWPGSDPSLKPMIISGHMDVVAANPADWQRNPFTPVVENGILYGRGSTDMKLDDALAITSLIELKREGYKPRRDIILEFSGDEETTMKTGAIIADKLPPGEIVLNMDGTSGVLNEKTGEPEYFSWKGAEKTYADFEVSVTNPGGHSSEPRHDNAIYQLSAALLRISKYQFKPELNALTRSYFVNAAKYEDPKTAAAMRAFAANPADKKAIATLSDNFAMIGKIGTTCVATMLNGGHALNALPQRASANINCRIFPGHTDDQIMAELKRVVDDPAVTIKNVSAGSVATPASPMRADLTAAIAKALSVSYPGVPVFPSMTSGASDSMWFRNKGVPSYGISPLFIKDSENFSHGLNERTPVADIPASINYLVSLYKDLSQ